MLNNNKFLLGLFLLFVGMALLIDSIGLVSLKSNLVFAYALLGYGLISVYLSLGSDQRGRLFISTAAFLIGVVLYVISQYELLNKYDIILPSVLFISGSGFMVLFIDNTNEKSFLFSSLILYTASILIIYFSGSSGIIDFITRINIIFIDYWAVFLVLMGLGVLLNRYK
ncbi:MAG: hypothetical protein K9J16_07775 [Melioribacteraceae bacterium]|nr:hypothetical protein [Melioribacteraceae bacterium]MCF8353329.1 hypothetical protein [Melioribacteraceae bacterium]MCF8393193.1 hypothetical protein [Melioribacteraceae bacterium]MCF8419055.1 hypothetical protein [Melioribacteraceae bacterium]